MDRSFPCRCAQYDRPFDDADGHYVLVGSVAAVATKRKAGASVGSPWHNVADCAVDTAVVDYVASAMAALATRVLHQRRAQPGQTSTVAVSDLPMDRIRIRWTGGWICSAEFVGAHPRNPIVRLSRS